VGSRGTAHPGLAADPLRIRRLTNRLTSLKPVGNAGRQVFIDPNPLPTNAPDLRS